MGVQWHDGEKGSWGLTREHRVQLGQESCYHNLLSAAACKVGVVLQDIAVGIIKGFRFGRMLMFRSDGVRS
jgi:hypothetical protein